jgi:uncharacterized DUF497 family protein
MRFEWDANKNRANVAKHAVDFDLAVTALFDSHQIEGPGRETRGEKRYSLIGRAANGKLLLVVYSWRQHENETRCRIISARAASRQERRRYQAVH